MSYSNDGKKWTKAGIEIPTAPIQQERREARIPLEIAEEAYKEYVHQYGHCQTLERLNQRGGFGAIEIAILLYERLKRLCHS